MAEEPRFYYPTGEFCFEIPTKSGKGMKAPTVADARELGLLPSVTTILSIIRKPGLEQWLLNSTKEEADQAREQAADYGKRLHATVADWLAGNEVDEEMEPVIEEVAHFWQGLGWMVRETERCFALPSEGFAGTADLIAIDRETEGLVIADWKTQRTKGKVNFYPEWALQLAAYAAGLGHLGECRLASVVISTTEPGLIGMHYWSDESHERYYRDFCAAKSLWYSSVGPGCDLRTEVTA